MRLLQRFRRDRTGSDMAEGSNNKKTSAAEFCYRFFIILLAIGFFVFISACFITAKSVVGNETAVRKACAVLSSVFFALVIMAFITLVLCWVAMRRTERANLMVSTLLLTVSDICLALNIKWAYTVYAYGSGRDSFVESQIGKTVESYYDFLSGVYFRWLLLGFACAFILILGAVSFFHIRRARKERRA